MNVYAAIAAMLGYLGLANARATATIGGTHLAATGLWLLAAAVVLVLAAAVLYLAHVVMRDGGLWLAARPAGAA